METKEREIGTDRIEALERRLRAAQRRGRVTVVAALAATVGAFALGANPDASISGDLLNEAIGEDSSISGGKETAPPAARPRSAAGTTGEPPGTTIGWPARCSRTLRTARQPRVRPGAAPRSRFPALFPAGRKRHHA